ncbi:MAG: DUF3300 domain-containing protein [Woeseiaceae bacterium]|nr:DUF3300 domain-containing protein [Woeseiaceae bacterium]
MKTRNRSISGFLSLAVLLASAAAYAQVPVDDEGNPVGEYEPGPAAVDEDLVILTEAELEELVGPIALYPDDLLAIVLPASTYPLQIVEAARFVEALKQDKSLEPDEDWDDSVVALTNYPEVLEMLNDDLDWTFRLGEAVVAQQTDVIQAIEAFRDRAYAAGNLKSDEFQVITNDDGVIEISPAQEDVIYVPYYEPERVVVYQPRPVYYYYPRAYPVYYYPYPLGYTFDLGYFWGVTTAFHIGWHTHHLHTWHHSYFGHPYYGHYYYPRYWYRRPDIHVYNNYYSYGRHGYSRDRYRRGDYWRPTHRRTVRSSDRRITRTRHYASTATGSRNLTPEPKQREIRFRERSERNEPRLGTSSQRRSTAAGPRSNDQRQSTLRRSAERSRATMPRSERRRPTIRPTAQPSTEHRNTLTRAPSGQRQSTVRPSVRQKQPTRAQVQRHRSEPRPQVQRQQAAPRPQVQRQRAAPRPQVQRQRAAPRPQVQRQQSSSAPRREARSRPSRPESSGSESRSSRSRSHRR